MNFFFFIIRITNHCAQVIRTESSFVNFIGSTVSKSSKEYQMWTWNKIIKKKYILMYYTLMIYSEEATIKTKKPESPIHLGWRVRGWARSFRVACIIPFPRIPNRYQKIFVVLSVFSGIKHPPHTRIFSKWQDHDFWRTRNARYTV